MTPDPSREWYVYFKEQEMGPLSETDLQSKVSVGELDSSAFVFTEGMSDWASIDEVEVLTQISQSQGVVETRTPDAEPIKVGTETSHANVKVEQVGREFEKETITETNAEADVEISPLEARLDAGLQNEKKSRRPLVLRWLLIGFVLLFLVGVLLDYAKIFPPIVPRTADPNTRFQEGPRPDLEAAPTPTDLMWAELSSLRLSRDRQGAPFRISSVLLSPERPIITGSVSSLIETDRIHLVVYPEVSRSLMERPRVWWFDLPLVDGYFAAGPFSIGGGPLPPGTYKVMAQTMGKFLGVVSFEVGSYPTGPDLEVELKGLQNQRAMASAEELKVLEALFSEFDALYEALRRDTVRYAIRGEARRAAWSKAMQPWTETFSKTYHQLSEQSAVTYYPDLRSRLDTFAKELVKIQGLMDFYSERGRVGFEKRAGRRYNEVWNSLQKDRDLLKSEVLAQANQTQVSVSLDEEQIKARLLEKR
jgi:hypothetical protein